MENTVTLSLEKYHELIEYEKAVKERKTYSFTEIITCGHYSFVNKKLQTTEDAVKLINIDLELENTRLKGEINTKNFTILSLNTELFKLKEFNKPKKWWKIW